MSNLAREIASQVHTWSHLPSAIVKQQVEELLAAEHRARDSERKLWRRLVELLDGNANEEDATDAAEIVALRNQLGLGD